MRDDLLDAQAAVDWAVAQIPLLQERLTAWERDSTYVLMVEPDLDSSYKLLAAYPQRLFDRRINAEAGAIINSIRSSLDMVASALATRNGVKPSNKTHFPIFNSQDAFCGPKGIESKSWLSKDEKTTINELKPYKGGDTLLYPLHQLDIRRKHERLLTARPRITEFAMQADGGGLERLNWDIEHKTILYRLPATSRFSAAQHNSHITAKVTFNEPSLGLIYEPADTILPRFAERVAEIIKLFDV
jgi:hypothetical protein